MKAIFNFQVSLAVTFFTTQSNFYHLLHSKELAQFLVVIILVVLLYLKRYYPEQPNLCILLTINFGMHLYFILSGFQWSDVFEINFITGILLVILESYFLFFEWKHTLQNRDSRMRFLNIVKKSLWGCIVLMSLV